MIKPSQILFLASFLSFSVLGQTPAVTTPFKITDIRVQNGNAIVTWQGGAASNQLLHAASLYGPWENVGGPTTATSVTYALSGPVGFFRVMAALPASTPTVSLTTPANGSTVSGNVALAANASNSSGSTISRVEFYCDNGVLVGTSSNAPYSVNCDTTAIANGGRSFYCKAYDVTGKSAASATNSVTVNNVTTTPGTYAWAKTLSGLTVADLANVNGVAVDHSGNTVVVGNFAGMINFGGTTLVSSGGQDIFVAKYSPAGALLWAKRYGDVYDQYASAVAIDSSNNIVVVGEFAGTVNFGGSNLTEVATPSFYYSSFDIFAAKLSPSGGNVWSKSFGGGGTEYASSVAIDSNNDVILAGHYSIPANTTQLNFGGGPLGNYGAQDFYVAKISGVDASYKWAVHHGNTDGTFSYSLYANSVAVDRNGDVFLGVFSTGGTVNLGGGNVSGAGILLAKYSGSTGGYVWSKTLGTPADCVKAVATDPSGNVIITGGFNGTVDFGGVSLTSPRTTGIFVVKYSNDGQQVIWAKGFGGGYYGQDLGYGLAVDANGNVGVTGTVQSSYIDFGGGALYGDSTLNMFVVKLNASGNYVWAKRLKTGATLNYGCAAAFDGSGDLISGGYCGGTTDFGGGAVSVGVSAQNGYLVKYAP